MKAVFFLVAPVVGILFSPGAVAADPPGGSEAAAPQKLEVTEFPAALVEDVFVPVPSEIFAVLDKLGEPDWRGELVKEGYGIQSDRTLIALVFGIAVADGFLAVEAEDRDAIQRTGREVLRLANAIGIEGAVTPHVQSILDAAREENWNAIRRELDRTQVTVRETMEKMRDEDLARCVSIGGWLRGTEIVCALIADSYSSDKAELLNQPGVVDHFRGSIAKMNDQVRTQAEIVKISAGLKSIESLMDASDDDAIDADVVGEIHRICAGLLDGVRGKGSRAE